eukprot:GHRR01026083.1.p3 GENE.GHRR01026083.1~~GHRR01026083.1.p3  ORF type:complete len:100 (+),score=24.34 GHRR01026083.1:198-497(+)
MLTKQLLNSLRGLVTWLTLGPSKAGSYSMVHQAFELGCRGKPKASFTCTVHACSPQTSTAINWHSLPLHTAGAEVAPPAADVSLVTNVCSAAADNESAC